jgi:hypothetical protein
VQEHYGIEVSMPRVRTVTLHLAQVLATLRTREEPADCPDEKAPVRAALRYLGNRTNQLDYVYALPAGSGLIESGHLHVPQARIKKPAPGGPTPTPSASSAPSAPTNSATSIGPRTDFTSDCALGRCGQSTRR